MIIVIGVLIRDKGITFFRKGNRLSYFFEYHFVRWIFYVSFALII